MKNTILTIIILLGALIFSSCKEEFLDIKDDSKINSSSFPASVSDIEKEIGSIYGFRSGKVWHFPQVMASFGMEHFMFDGKSDGSGFPSAQTNGLMYKVNEPELWGENLFKWSYDNIKRENSAISDIQKYQANAPEIEQEYLNVMLGEAYLSRAVEYYYLVGFYGEAIGDNDNAKGMMLVDEIAQTREETFTGRSSVKATYEFIISDLKKAIELMGDHKWPNGQRGRFTGIGAKALLGKVYVFLERWSDATTTLAEVVNDPDVQLASSSSFKDMWVDGNEAEFNGESLLAINNTGSVGDSWIGGSNQGIVRMYGAAYWKDDKVFGSGSWNMGYYPDANIERFGYMQDHWGTPMNPTYIAEANALRSAAIPAHDPRLFTYTYQPWVDQITVEGFEYPVSYPAEGMIQWYEQFQTFALRKFTYTDFDGNLNQDRVNSPIIRVADVYLLYAEALIESGGSSATALEYINKVHRRAYGYDPNTASVVDYSSLSDATKAPSTDVVCFNNPLRYERWAELQGESCWWFDIKRWRMAQEESNYYVFTTADGTKRPIVWNDRYYSWPIPESEIASSNGLVEQNTGW
ncbi:MAG: RagB/SusD family nutrient uptake outer membrane protein [Bacteroidales bacterium]|nr:RagB/SusD family nutrient uptake outer membrane protein [Bacteroidales bacterium]